MSTVCFGEVKENVGRPKSSKSVARDIDRTFRENLRLIEESMQGLNKNSRAYLDRVMARNKLQQLFRSERLMRGLDAQNLGLLQKPKFHFVATIAESTPQPNAEQHEKFMAEMDELYESPGQPEEPEPAAPAANKQKKGKK
jgi:hypothetical protein